MLYFSLNLHNSSLVILYYIAAKVHGVSTFEPPWTFTFVLDGWMDDTCDLTSFLTVFQSYQDDGWVVI